MTLPRWILIVTLALAIAIAILFLMPRAPSTKPLIPPEIREAIGDAPRTVSIKSRAFSEGEKIPQLYTCDGKDISPPLTIENVPSNTVSLVLIVYDPDAPRGTFYHWLLYKIPLAERIELPEDIPKTVITPYGVQGYNDFGKIGYGGPCPPPGRGAHRYVFLVLALDRELPEKPLHPSELLELVKGHVLAYGYTVGLYER